MSRYVIFILICSVSCILHADKKKLSKSELDRIIDERILLYESGDVEHGQDIAQGAIEALKKEGVTDYEIVESMAKCLRRDMNCPKEKAGCVRANAAIWWIGYYGDQNQISNLLYVAKNTTRGTIASLAIQAYYGKIKDKERFLNDAMPLLERSYRLKSAIWRCLMEEAKGPMRERIVAIASEKVNEGYDNLYYADLILEKWKPGYADSQERRKLIIKAVEDPNVKKIAPRGSKHLLDRLKKESSK